MAPILAQVAVLVAIRESRIGQPSPTKGDDLKVTDTTRWIELSKVDGYVRRKCKYQASACVRQRAAEVAFHLRPSEVDRPLRERCVNGSPLAQISGFRPRMFGNAPSPRQASCGRVPPNDKRRASVPLGRGFCSFTDHFHRERFPPPVVRITRFITTSIVS